MFKTEMHVFNDKLNFHVKIKSGDKRIFMFIPLQQFQRSSWVIIRAFNLKNISLLENIPLFL